MLPSALAFFITPPSISNHICKLDIHRQYPFSSPNFLTFSLKESEFFYRKSVRLCKPMAAGSDEDVSPAISALEQEALIENGGVAFYQTVGGLHAIVNHLICSWHWSIYRAGNQVLIYDD
ncbi:hypothetical protein L1987_18280 [Smallanthus sonchifolius]|uniref:Uncharacterized protein n=1 Tax=Smallanthus sonchifolius TaxID=185202 RepID=A0ACB9IZU3_9ASTR|nr:hypothetical protein L1987_18280 [Smallanthus sonchifolius]